MSARRAIALVARREIRERLRSRAFLYSTLFLLLIVGASTAFTDAFSRKNTYDVAVTAPAPPGLGAALQRAAKPFDATVRLRELSSAAGECATGPGSIDGVSGRPSPLRPRGGGQPDGSPSPGIVHLNKQSR